MKFEITSEGNRELFNSSMNLGIFATRFLTNYSKKVMYEIVAKFHKDYVFYFSYWSFKNLNIPINSTRLVIIHDEESWKNRIKGENIFNIKVLNIPKVNKRSDHLFLDLFISQKVRNILILEATKFSKNLEIISTYSGERGLNVFCLPGRITDLSSEGSNKMIFNGAIPLYTLDLLNV